MEATVLNISTYRFTPLRDLPAWRDELHARALEHGLKGTVLLAEEGINLFLAGAPHHLRSWMEALRARPGLHDLPAKESWSATQPFQRLKVKIKREIIRMDRPAIAPAAGRAPAVDALTLARWIENGRADDGRPLKLLDTRNGFEVDAGAFVGAIDWRLQRFSDFPARLAAHGHELRDAAVVSYCTGGIRCEKAALLMREAGLAHSWQLDGGILQYFEHTQGRAPGWRGHCFVFDERERLEASLAPARPTPDEPALVGAHPPLERP